jgi:tetratricopeptide (TPR) repeat protein
LLGAIARRYQGLGKFDDAERLLLEYIKQWPDYWAYEKLAEIHAQRHNTSRWLEVLERFLAEGRDSGFEKATVRVAIANYYMTQKQWDMARPHADAAAATGAVWAMICAQNCALGRKDWKQAEKWARAMSERYPSEAWDRWFTLCRKTGTGDIEAAFAFTSKWVTENEKAAAPEEVARIAAFYLSSFQLKKALPALGRWYEGSPSAGVGAIAWLVADLLDDHAARDRYFELMENLQGTDSPQMAAIWRLFREAVDRDGGGSLDLPAIAKEQENSQSGNMWLIDFIIGMFLQKHGKPVEAREFLQKVVDNPAISEPFGPVARDTIRKLDENAKNAKANDKPTTS